MSSVVGGWSRLADTLLELSVDDFRQRLHQMSALSLITEFVTAEGDYLLREISERGDTESLNLIRSHISEDLWKLNVCIYIISLLCCH